jgi:acetyl esterase/lipase
VAYAQGCSRHLLDIYFPVEQQQQEPAAAAASETSDKEDDENENEEDDNGEEKKNGGAPVVVFLTGGAWIIGYKMWGTLIGRALCAHGVMLVIPDYRNFPQASGGEMIEDCDLAIQVSISLCFSLPLLVL